MYLYINTLIIGHVFCDVNNFVCEKKKRKRNYYNSSTMANTAHKIENYRTRMTAVRFARHHVVYSIVISLTEGYKNQGVIYTFYVVLYNK